MVIWWTELMAMVFARPDIRHGISVHNTKYIWLRLAVNALRHSPWGCITWSKSEKGARWLPYLSRAAAAGINDEMQPGHRNDAWADAIAPISGTRWSAYQSFALNDIRLGTYLAGIYPIQHMQKREWLLIWDHWTGCNIEDSRNKTGQQIERKQ